MASADRDKALDAALAQIDRQFGKGSVMRLGDEVRVADRGDPDRVDRPRRRARHRRPAARPGGGDLRPGVVAARPRWRCTRSPTRSRPAASRRSSTPSTRSTPSTPQKLGVDTDALLVSQPDTGEQALEIADMLIRSGALDIIVIDSVAALVPRAEIEGEMGDSHVGLQARLMSQALRKITGALSQSKTTAIFINQLREKIGVMFGCFSYRHPGHAGRRHAGEDRQDRQPADGRRGAVLRRRRPTRSSPARSSTGSTTARPTSSCSSRWRSPAATAGRSSPRRANHLIRTPGGWREAGELIAGDRVMLAETHPAERAAVAGRARRR